jgi:hypothetical protein
LQPEPRWLGVAVCTVYWLCKVPVPAGAGMAKFYVQAEGKHGLVQGLEAAASLEVALPPPSEWRHAELELPPHPCVVDGHATTSPGASNCILS